MLIALHKQARTTPAVRAEIAGSSEPVAVQPSATRSWRVPLARHVRKTFSGANLWLKLRVPAQLALHQRPVHCLQRACISIAVFLPSLAHVPLPPSAQFP